ncbi:MAG: type VI secretion system tip protein TssI/VgrG, partial [Desulfobacula sp.]
MTLLKEKKFSFKSLSPGINENTFAVVEFTGFEAISSLYDFEIVLITEDTDIEISKILENQAQFKIHRDDGTPVHFNGILAEFEEQREYNGIIFYRARLVPKIWWLTLTHHNQVCLDLSVRDIIEQTLKDGGLFSGIDFDFDLQKKYPQMEYVCQYGETHFDFVSRWAQREGIYYFFAQSEDREKLIFTDTKIAHKDLQFGDTLYYSPVSGLDSQKENEVIQSFTCRQQMLPAKVLLKDYNYEKPSLEMVGQADVDPKGRGEKYIYGEYFISPEEGNRLAALRAEELLSRKKEFFGQSTVPFINPGYTFDLKDHYRSSFNSKYLVTKVTHKGHQKGYLTAGLSEAIADKEEQMSYENEFTAIPSDVQFRPALITEKPKISGTLHANIDAESSGEYAELDSQGRYKVRLPFDLNSNHGDGKASAYVRMMQPYAGAKEGMHFPLRKGTEVLLTFIDGNPDRPVIAGAIPNPETASPVNEFNQTESVIQTKGDNKIRIEDREDSERIIMESPKVNSFIRIGTPNDPVPADSSISSDVTGDNAVEDRESGDGIKIQTDGGIELYTGSADLDITTENPTDINLQSKTGDINIKACNVNIIANKDAWEAAWGNQYSSVIGNSFQFGLGNSFSLKESTETNISVGTVLGGFLGSKCEFMGGQIFGLSGGRKLDLFIGDQYDEGFNDWKKHSNKEICIDAEKGIEIIGGDHNNAKITGKTDSLRLEHGEYKPSVSDNPLEKILYHGFPALIAHLVLAGINSAFTIPFTFLDDEAGTDKKISDVIVNGTSAALLGLTTAIVIIFLASKKKKVTDDINKAVLKEKVNC